MTTKKEIDLIFDKFCLKGKISEKHAKEIRAMLKAEFNFAFEKVAYDLQQIAEVYIGMDGFIPQTAPEAYQQQKLKEMYDGIECLLKKLK